MFWTVVVVCPMGSSVSGSTPTAMRNVVEPAAGGTAVAAAGGAEVDPGADVGAGSTVGAGAGAHAAAMMRMAINPTTTTILERVLRVMRITFLLLFFLDRHTNSGWR